MFRKLTKLVAALGLIASIGAIAASFDASAGPCYCRKGVGGTTYCTCS